MQRIRATINYTDVAGGPGVITLYTRSTGLENGATADLTSSRLQDALDAGKALFSVYTSFVADTFVDTIDPATGSITDSNPTAAWTVTGTTTGHTGPAVLAICVTWKTTAVIAGRRVRGRTFLSPLTNAVADIDGTPSAPYMTAANDLGDAWTDNGLTNTYAVVWHRPVGGAGGTAEDITAHSIRDKFAVLRSRRD
jgi:hypothetical protein